MSQAEKNVADTDNTRRNIFVGVAIITALLVAGVIYWVTRPASQTAEQQLENALRPGSPEFEQYRERLVIDFNPDEDATQGQRTIGDVVITMNPTIRNFTGRTISGLEVRATGLDISGRPIKERTVILIPTRQAELEPNKTMKVPITIEGFKQTDTPANLKVELTGVRFKR